MLLAIFAHAFADWWLLSKQASQEQSRISTVFQRMFPGQPISDARIQTQRMLAQRSASGDQCLRHLNNAAPLLASSDTLQLQGLDYDGEFLVLRLKAPVVADIDEFSQALSQRGLSARVLSASLGADGVDGTVRLSELDGGSN